MKTLLTTLVLCLGLCLPLLPDSPTFAYEESAADRGFREQMQREQSSQQAQREIDRAQYQSGENDRLHHSVPQFNPSDFSPTNLNPYNLYQPGGRAQVCRRTNNAVFCY